jgi:protocatechuate 4,5-dioxygenase alpha subunit
MEELGVGSSPFGPSANPRGAARYRGELAQQALRLNRFLVHISQRDNRDAYLANEEASMQEWNLSTFERELVRHRNYEGLLVAGVNIYAIAKSGYVFGATLLEIGAAMRGQTTAEFLAEKRRS